MIRSIPGSVWVIAVILVIVAELDPILAYLAFQATRVTGTLQHYSGRIAIGAALVGLVVHVVPWFSEHGWKVVEKSAILVFGVALIPAVFPLLEAFGGGPVPKLVSTLFNALTAGLGG